MTVAVAGHVTRTELALSDLQLNADPYIMSAVFDPGGISWDRRQAESAFVHGSITVHRRKGMATATVGLEIAAADIATLQSSKQTLIDAFTQDVFELHVTFDATTYAWSCEAADFSVTWERARIHGLKQLVVFEVPRQPVPLLGPV